MWYREANNSRINSADCSCKIHNSIHCIKKLWNQKNQILFQGINNINYWLSKNGLIVFDRTMIDGLQTDSYFERHALDRLGYFSLEINLDRNFLLMAIDTINYDKVVKSKHIRS